MRTYIHLLLTNRCNRSCGYCLLKDMLNKTEDALDKDVLLNYLSYLHKGDVVEITGGEPTLVPWLEELVRFLNDKEVYTLLRTNGYKLFKNVYKWLLVALNTHDEDEAYVREKESLLRGTDVIIGKTVPFEFFKEGQKAPPTTLWDGNLVLNGFGNARMIGHQGHVWNMICGAMDEGNYLYKLGTTTDDYIDVDRVYKPCPNCRYLLAPWTWKDRLGLEGEVPENGGIELDPAKRPYDAVIRERMDITAQYAEDDDVYVFLTEGLRVNDLFRNLKVRGYVADDSDPRAGEWMNGLYIMPYSKWTKFRQGKDIKLYGRA